MDAPPFDREQLSARPESPKAGFCRKLVNASDSCHSNKSSMSINMEEVKADVNVYLSPEKEELADLMKNIQRTTDTASFASDLVTSVAASITRSDSVNSLGGWSSSGVVDDEDEVDVDAEFDKACLLEAHNNDLDMAFDGSAEEDALLPKTNEEIRGKRKHRITLKEVAKEVLNEVSSGSGHRSRIPRPQALERFRIRNAIANSQLRQRFLKRTPSSDIEDTRLSNSSDC
ncbi:hypothetical protein TELCIR_06816 [Teladorsagia circumcincta]|uniref:Uncharacterized protein n=1 Tax=Teladorsagia circumcincta TaxID=45464 RepID=A0A2G9UPA8_TELCI|nr:hypothetical protein TELCIR_06816 [Teladorsagia circumcincta]